MAENIDDQFGRLVWEPAVNGTNEVIPRYACVRFYGSSNAPLTRPPVLMVQALKPDDYGAQHHHRIAWHQDTEPGKVGYFAMPVMSPVLAGYKRGLRLSLPNPGELWGPVSGDWELQKDVGGFRVVGFPPGGLANRSAVLVLFEPLLSATATLTENLPDAGTADADVEASNLTVEVNEVLGLTSDIPSGSKVRIQWDIALPGWVVIAAECPGGGSSE